MFGALPTLLEQQPPEHCSRLICLCISHTCSWGCRYQHLLRLLESTRDFEEQAQLETAEEYKSALISNMALALFHQGEFARSVDWCDKALQLDPVNAKVSPRGGVLCVAVDRRRTAGS